MHSKTAQKILLLVLKISISSVLLTIIFRKAGLNNVLATFRAMDIRFFFLSSFFYIITIVLASVRWRMLLTDRFSFGKLCSLNFIGSFFNYLLPGAVGGDSVKIYYLYRDTQQGGSSFGSVFLDRYIGLSGLLFIGFVGGMSAFSELRTVHMQWAIPLLFAGFIGGSLLVFGLKLGKGIHALADFYDYFHGYLGKRKILLKTFFLSLLIQSLNVGSVYAISRGIGQELTFSALFVFFPIIVIITMAPLSISGLGIRESAFVVLFGLTGVPAETSTAISFLWFLSSALSSCIGLIEYIRYRKTG